MVLNSIPVTFTFLLTFSFIVFSNSQTCKPYLDTDPVPREGRNITEVETEYPTNCTDYIWSFTQNVEIKIHRLKIDGQSGDFVMISSYPPNIPDPDNINLDTMIPAGDFKLISWDLDSDANNPPFTVNILSPKGSFLYFHGAAEDPNSIATHQEGFLIEILPFEKYVPTVEPTTEKVVPTPHPGQEAFVVRFLSGKHPDDFMTALPVFKRQVAVMANNYSAEKQLDIPNEIEADDIVVPTKDIRYCDEKWPEYGECVEVKFGIAVLDSNGTYIMTKDKIDEMWESYNKEPLEKMGLNSIEPKESPPEMVPYVWVAAMLGVIAVFSGGLCVIWLKGVTEDIRNDSRPIEQNVERNENLVDGNGVPFYASVNPIIAEWQERIGNNQGTVTEDLELVEQRRRGGHGHGHLDGDIPFYNLRRNQYLDVPLN